MAPHPVPGSGVPPVPDRRAPDTAVRLVPDRPAPDTAVCRGTLLSREQYLHDVEREGYADGRLRPHGTMSVEEIATWTDAIDGRKTGTHGV